MSYRTQTPYGKFKSLIALLAEIQKDPLEFILKYGHFNKKYPFTSRWQYHQNHTNTATNHFIYSVVRNELLGKDPNWIRLP